VNAATDPKQPITKFTSSNGDNVFMKGRQVLCVASLHCTLVQSDNNNNKDDDSTISSRPNNNNNQSPSTTLQEEESVLQQQNKIAILCITIGAIVSVLIASVLLSTLFCQKNQKDYNDDDICVDNDSLPSYQRRDIMIQKIRRQPSIQTEHDASTISTHDHHYLDNHSLRQLEVVQQQQPSNNGVIGGIIMLDEGMI